MCPNKIKSNLIGKSFDYQKNTSILIINSLLFGIYIHKVYI